MNTFEIHAVDLPLVHPFTIARGTKYAAKNVILTLEGTFGKAYGECAPNPRYGQSQEEAVIHFEDIKDSVRAFDASSLQDITSFIEELYPEGGAYSAALEMLLLDAYAKRLKQPIWQLLSCPTSLTPKSSFTLGISDLDQLAEKVAQAGDYPILKVKLGGDHDIETIERIRELTDKTIRIDANEGWKNVEYALKMAEKMKEFGVELIEQPLHASQKVELIEFKKHSPLPVCADESCEGGEDISYLAEAFDVINIKLMKIGSILKGIDLAREAKKHNLKVMVGCMLESSLAISAGAIIATEADYADLDGHVLLKDMPFSRLQTDQSLAITLNNQAGLGLNLESSLDEWDS